MFILLDKTPRTEKTKESYKIIVCNIEKDESIVETNRLQIYFRSSQ